MPLGTGRVVRPTGSQRTQQLSTIAGGAPQSPLAAPTPARSAAPPPAPTPPAPVSQPQTPPVTSPDQRYRDDLATARSISDDMLNGVSSARIQNPYQQQTDEYLEMLKKRLGGLDSEEMSAARDQGILELDRHTAQNLERYGSIAGASGVSGGARAALMRKALDESNFARGTLERQLVLDNIAAKDRAYQAYGGALGGATATGMDVERYNAGAQDRDTGLSLSLPFDIMSGIGGYRAEDRAAASDAAALDTVKNYINQQSSNNSTSTNGGAGTSGQPVQGSSVDSITQSLNTLGAEIGAKFEQLGAGNVSPQEYGAALDKARKYVDELIDSMYPNATEAEKSELYREKMKEWLWNSGFTNSRTNPQPRAPGVNIETLLAPPGGGE